MNLFAPLSLIAATISAFIGFFVFTRDTSARLNRLFLLLCLASAYWSFARFEMSSAQSVARATFWVRAAFLTPFCTAFLAHFSIQFCEQSKRFGKRFLLFFAYGPATLLALGSFAIPLHLTHIRWGWEVSSSPQGKWFWLISYVWTLAMGLFSLLLTAHRFRSASTDSMRKMAKHVFISMFFPVILGACTHRFGFTSHLHIPELTAMAATLMYCFIAYAIWRHQLFSLTPTTAAESIINTMSDALFLVDADYTIQSINNAGLALLGYQRHELIGHPMSKIFSSDNLDDTTRMTNFRRALNSGVVNDVEALFQTHEGKTMPVSLSWTITRNRDGDILGTTFIGRDITERIRSKELLQRSRDELQMRVAEQTRELKISNDMLRKEIAERLLTEERLAAEKESLSVTLSSLAEGVITTDKNGTITLLNKAAEQLCGWLHSEACGHHISEVITLLHAKDRTPCPDPIGAVLHLDEQAPPGEELILRKRDGQEVMITNSGAPMHDKNGQIAGVVLVVRDITETHKLEDELLKARKLESMAVMADGIAHDFNNILTGITTNLFVARMQVPRYLDAYELLLETEKAAYRASALTKQLLTFSKGLAPLRQRCTIGPIIEEAAGFCLSDASVDYELTLEPQLAEVDIDRGMIDQTLNHIIQNAREATPVGGTIRISASNTQLSRRQALPLPPGNYVAIAVEDDGEGIEQQNLQRVFDPYFTTKPDANGLGLTIAYSIMRKHGGILTVTSTPGCGTCVTAYLPACSEAVVAEDEELSRPKNGLAGKVLLMDDHSYLLKSTGMLLSHLGYTVELANSGEEAVEKYRLAMHSQNPFDVTILDLSVATGLGGKETLELLRKLDKDVCAFISSGYSSDEVMQNYSRYGFVGAIHKPYEVEVLNEAIREAVQLRHTKKHPLPLPQQTAEQSAEL